MAFHMPFFSAGPVSGSTSRPQTRVVTFTITGLLCFAIWIGLVVTAVRIISRHLF